MSIIAHFIQLVSSATLVAIISLAYSLTQLFPVTQMVLSRSLSVILILASSATALAVFMTGDYAEFAKSLGVFSILLIQRTTIHKFVPKFVSQVSVINMLIARNELLETD